MLYKLLQGIINKLALSILSFDSEIKTNDSESQSQEEAACAYV